MLQGGEISLELGGAGVVDLVVGPLMMPSRSPFKSAAVRDLESGSEITAE